jgi:hypothetical protein
MLRYKIEKDDCIWKYSNPQSFVTDQITPFGKVNVFPPGFLSQDVLICRHCGHILGQLTDENMDYQMDHHKCRRP